MKLNELRLYLEKDPAAKLRFALPNGEFIPAHTHITEVARIDKRFIDCGGTVRTDSICRFQTWHSDDLRHRLNAGILLKILGKADDLLLSDDLDVDVEHELGFISQFPLESVEAGTDEIILRLGARHTACLAQDQCKSPAPDLPEYDVRKFDFKEPAAASRCCGGN